MKKYYITLSDIPQKTDPIFSAIWVAHGAIDVNGSTLRSGDAAGFDGSPVIKATDAKYLQFTLQTAPPESPVLACEQINCASGDVLVRLDQVSFPAGAVAYCHVHPGPGIRYLVEGRLRLEADNHVQDALPGHVWFEPANTPVRATAGNVPLTRFIRFMVLPVNYEGKPSIQILDPADATKPKPQTTHRFLDRILTLG